jgi:hypothetical protein
MLRSGAKIPFFTWWRLRRYAPQVIKKIPVNPDRSGNSPKIRNDVTIKNNGVNDKKGIVRERGETLIALI